ncbi:GxxExxY protein [Marinifilum fragile]
MKATESFHDLHLAQTLTYMKLSGCKLGLLVNFNVSRMKHGIKRLIL